MNTALTPLLDVRGLQIGFGGRTVVHGIDFQIAPGEKLALVGESGSGKTVSALSLLRLVQNAEVRGQALLGGRDLLALSERELQTLVKIASGRRLSDIAEELMLSPKTVSVYRSRVLEKLKLSNNAELTVYAIRNQLV